MMKKNFLLNDDAISIQAEELYFDLHNCFDLSGLAINLAEKQVTLLLCSNNILPKHQTLRIIFSEVDFLYLSNGLTMKMVRDITELGYKPSDDFDHDWLVNEKNSSENDHLIIRLEGDEFIRLHGKTAELFWEGHSA